MRDIVLEIPAGTRTFWPSSAHEPLVIGLTLCFAACYPWQLRQLETLLALGRKLRANFQSCRGIWKPCESVWCASCNVPYPKDRFHQYVPHDESGFEWQKPGEPSRQGHLPPNHACFDAFV